jgi:hypothetical protein
MGNSLRVLHVIPSAFEYFDDIKNYAFGLVGEMDRYTGIVADVFTLQYGSPTHSEKEKTSTLAPEQEYIGSEPLPEAVEDFLSYDLIHLHAPFLGGAKQMLQWKQNHPETPLVITYYRDVDVTDLIALGIRWYSNYYLKKLFRQANLITVFPWSEKAVRRISGYDKTNGKIKLLSEFGVYNSGTVLWKRLRQKETAEYFLELYNYLV